MVGKLKRVGGLKKVLGLVLLFVAGAAAGSLLGSYFAGSGSAVADVPLPLGYKLSIILWLPLALLVPVAVHELGHVAAGLSQGFVFRSLTVAFLHFYKDDDRLKFKWLKSIKGFAGLAICLPRPGQSMKQLAKQFIVYGAGGPAASLLLAIALLVLYFVFGADVTKTEPLKYTFAKYGMVAGFFSLFIFVITIIPAKANGYFTDGGRILSLLRGGTLAQLDLTILNVTAASCSGIPPEQLDRQQLEEAINLRDDSIFSLYCHSYLYLIAMQENNTTKAAQHLQVFAGGIDRIPDIAQSAVWLELAFFEAFCNKNPALARQHYSKAKPSGFISKDVYLRAGAALALSENKPEEAIELAEQALVQLPANMDKGAAIAYKGWLERICNGARNKSSVNIS